MDWRSRIVTAGWATGDLEIASLILVEFYRESDLFLGHKARLDYCSGQALASGFRSSLGMTVQCNCLAAFTVFAISIAIVIGPTPPGTGVIALAFFDTSSNATSPTSR